MTFQGSFMGGGTFSDASEIANFGQDMPTVSPLEAGKLSAEIWAAQVSGTTGVPTTSTEIIQRLQAIIPPRITGYGPGGLFGSSGARQIFTATATDKEALIFLSTGVLTSTGQVRSEITAAGPGWFESIKKAISLISALGLDKPLMSALKVVGTEIGKVIGLVSTCKAWTNFIGGFGPVLDAVPGVVAYLQTAFSVAMMLADKWSIKYFEPGYPGVFAGEPLALYLVGRTFSGRTDWKDPSTLTDFSDPAVTGNTFPGYTYNPFFREVFVQSINWSPSVPKRVLDLEDYRAVLASEAMRNFIKRPSYEGIQLVSRPYSSVYGCHTPVIARPLDRIVTDKASVKGAFVAAAYLFGNTACVRNLGKWDPSSMYPNRKDADDPNNYGGDSPYFYVGASGGISWFAETLNGMVLVCPLSTPTHGFNRDLLAKTLGAGEMPPWYVLGTEPNTGLPQPSKIADVSITSTPTSTGKRLVQMTVYKPAQKSKVIGKPIVTTTPVGRSTGITQTSTKTGQVAATVWYKNPLIWTGIGGGVVLASTGSYLLYRKLKKP